MALSIKNLKFRNGASAIRIKKTYVVVGQRLVDSQPRSNRSAQRVSENFCGFWARFGLSIGLNVVYNMSSNIAALLSNMPSVFDKNSDNFSLLLIGKYCVMSISSLLTFLATKDTADLIS